MEEILKTIISNLVDSPDSVEIKKIDEENIIKFEVKVAENDMKKVIGRQGRMAKSIRTVMKAIANKEHMKVLIEFIG